MRSYDNKKLLEGVQKKSVLAFIECHTGSCGSESRDVHLIYAGTDADSFAHELAVENAEMYGIYPGGLHDDEEDSDGVEYSEGIEGTAYLFHPDDLSSTHESAHQILQWLVELEAIAWKQGFSNSLIINVEEIKLVMQYDFKSFCELVEHNISGEFYISEVNGGNNTFIIVEAEKDERSSVANKERLFGKRDWNPGWTINEIITACRESRSAETSLDEMLGGDLASSEIVVIDLIEYIRELEKK